MPRGIGLREGPRTLTSSPSSSGRLRKRHADRYGRLPSPPSKISHLRATGDPRLGHCSELDVLVAGRSNRRAKLPQPRPSSGRNDDALRVPEYWPSDETPFPRECRCACDATLPRARPRRRHHEALHRAGGARALLESVSASTLRQNATAQRAQARAARSHSHGD